MKSKLRVVYIMMHKSISTAITLSLFLSSCGAYYNTFYNTKKLYKEAVREREKRQGDQPTPDLGAVRNPLPSGPTTLTESPARKSAMIFVPLPTTFQSTSNHPSALLRRHTLNGFRNSGMTSSLTLTLTNCPGKENADMSGQASRMR